MKEDRSLEKLKECNTVDDRRRAFSVIICANLESISTGLTMFSPTGEIVEVFYCIELENWNLVQYFWPVCIILEIYRL